MIYKQSESAGFSSGKRVAFARGVPAKEGAAPRSYRAMPVDTEKAEAFIKEYSRILPSGLRGVQDKEIKFSWGDDIAIISFQEWSDEGLISIYRSFSNQDQLDELSIELQRLFLGLTLQ